MKATLAKLIEKKFYKTKDVIVNKLNTFCMAMVITDDEYIELMLMVNEVYGDE